MAGHVFLTRGNLTTLHCDAWLVPADASVDVTRGFRAGLPDDLLARVNQRAAGLTTTPEDWHNHGTRVIPLDDDRTAPARPQPYLVNVGAVPGTPVAWYLEGLRQFVQAVAARHRGTGAVTKRPKSLIGLPLIGAGAGGAAGIRGDVIHALLHALHEHAATYDLDFALVLNSPQTFAAAQNARRHYLRERHGDAANPFHGDLDDALAREAHRLAADAAAGRLVLFLGAGVSVGAGLPSWRELLAALAQDASMDEEQRKALGRLHPLDQARLIEASLMEKGQGASLGEAVSRRLTARRHSLAHSLLASLPVSESVTMNYDTLFELASDGAGRPAAALPYQSVAGHSRWLLKLHGCVSHPRDIVLTRENYLRYADRRAALTGIVQALLITRHMLFIGFSLTDENFHRAIDDVRKAIYGDEPLPRHRSPFGTALLLKRDDLLQQLWRDDLHLTSMADQQATEDQTPARRLEIFLDLLLSEATRDASPILDPSFDGVLTDEEKALHGLLAGLLTAPAHVRASPAWQPVARLLHQLGAREQPD